MAFLPIGLAQKMGGGGGYYHAADDRTVREDAAHVGDEPNRVCEELRPRWGCERRDEDCAWFHLVEFRRV
jgi:hypothetical protein